MFAAKKVSAFLDLMSFLSVRFTLRDLRTTLNGGSVPVFRA
ncbi:hypothetical protein [Veronia nyctiphanis]|nr:hypothetical protein [Veronia nyctiphanis]